MRWWRPGTVQRCNGSSIILHERDEPLVISRYAKNLPTLEGGDRVELSTDSRGFVMSAVILNAPESPQGHTDARHTASGSGVVSKQTVRAVALKAAVDFASGRELTSKDVTRLAEYWEAWLVRGEGVMELTRGEKLALIVRVNVANGAVEAVQNRIAQRRAGDDPKPLDLALTQAIEDLERADAAMGKALGDSRAYATVEARQRALAAWVGTLPMLRSSRRRGSYSRSLTHHKSRDVIAEYLALRDDQLALLFVRVDHARPRDQDGQGGAWIADR